MSEQVLDGRLFRDLIAASTEYLAKHKKEVDALNVFPVPDGDTGTNMYLTLSAAAESVLKEESVSLSRASELASHGALMGARGNSGVILSQIFRGIARHFAGKEAVPPWNICLALDEAVSTAYKAVMKPVEGTILTVLRGMRDGAKDLGDRGHTVQEVLHACLARGKEVLQKTPEMLPVLRQAGVVDAGGKGLVYILEGALSALSTGVLRSSAETQSYAPSEVDTIAHDETLDIEDIAFPYDTQFLLKGIDLPLAEIREHLQSLGDSLLVVGSDSLARVHVHTKVPGDVLTYCLQYGVLSQVTIDNMVEQAQEAMALNAKRSATAVGATSSRAVSSGSLPGPRAISPAKETGIVTVVTGAGLTNIMKSLGCDLVIEGGPTMNPSTAELAAAVKTVDAKKIIFLPNNGNIFLAAKQAKKLTGRNMYIIPTKTIPQGVSALLSLNLSMDMEHNLKRAAKAIKRVRTGEVTFAARNGKFGKHVMRQGDILGLIDGKVEMVGEDPQEILVSIVSSMVRPDHEIVTIYRGKDVSQETGEAAAMAVRRVLPPDIEVELQDGGQPLYYYIVSSE
jgi:DAK2 domain fusion protein YloV